MYVLQEAPLSFFIFVCVPKERWNVNKKGVGSEIKRAQRNARISLHSNFLLSVCIAPFSFNAPFRHAISRYNMLSNKDDMEVVQYKTDTTWSMKQRQAFPVHDNDFALAAPGDNVGAAGLKRSEAAYDISEVTILEQEEGESLPPSLLTGSVTLSSKNPSVESLAVTTPLDGHQQYNTRQGDTMKHSEEFQESMAPTPPPKPKHYYHTVHDLKSLCDRALPPLPENTGSRASSTISDSGKNKGTLHQTKQRMVHWIGRPLNKIVTSMVGLHTFANQPEEAKVITPSSSVTSAAAGPVACRDNDVEDAVTTYSDSQLIYHESYYPEPATLPRYVIHFYMRKEDFIHACLLAGPLHRRIISMESVSAVQVCS